MSSEWVTTTWGELATLEYGGLGTNDYGDAGPFRAYGTNGMVGRTGIAEVDGPGVVIGRKGAYRGVHYSPEPFGVIGTAFYLRPRVELDLRWAYYQLLTVDINRLDSGSAIPSTSRYDFYRMKVIVPPIAEQRAIASVLGALDDKIELNRQISRTLESVVGQLFSERFGRHSEDLPRHWVMESLGDLAVEIKSKVNPQARSAEQFDHFSIPAFDGPRRPIREDGASIKSAKTFVPEGAVLVSRLNPRFPRVWLPVVDSSTPAIASTEFTVLMPQRGVPRSYLYGVATSPDFMRTLVVYATGTSGSHQRVRPETVMGLPVVRPDHDTLADFDAVAGPMLERSALGIEQASTLAAIRDALLPRLVSGAIRVSSLDDLMETVA